MILWDDVAVRQIVCIGSIQGTAIVNWTLNVSSFCLEVGKSDIFSIQASQFLHKFYDSRPLARQTAGIAQNPYAYGSLSVMFSLLISFVDALNIADFRAYNGDWPRGLLGVRQRIVCWLSTGVHWHYLAERKNQHQVRHVQNRLRGKFVFFLSLKQNGRV